MMTEKGKRQMEEPEGDRKNAANSWKLQRTRNEFFAAALLGRLVCCWRRKALVRLEPVHPARLGH